ncbi:beta-ketoacyl synthase-like protein [Actinomadura pelletieri DSM 43383]|uniref:Beta-ketoacyl synthase-like protein n=1 Tax=Actinomadura pelletieri DSM 43383 TaxID=1120940 RepID=A0A495QZN0_9ACTN|nr:polyketide synthase [Actinomadura pelletieri]RKS79663.1 beta-ketoacyl synthase-like protein [Actinomadura pelletieri DSM 43383]
MPEPIAVIGIACLYPGARGAGDYWRLCGDPPASVPSTLDDVRVDVARYRIPPVQRRSMSRMQVLMLEAARQCLTDAGYTGRPLGTDRTDVIAGICFGLDRQYANALRIEGSRYARDLADEVPALFGEHARETGRRAAEEMRALLPERLGASPHDRVGEMASTIPARIAGAFRLRGRTFTLESADATSFAALAHAVNALRGDRCDAALVLTGQRWESPLFADALAAKGLPADVAEGVGALLLKRRSSAVHDGDRVYASILGCALEQDSRPGTLRYSTSGERRHRVARACHDAAGVEPGSVRYVERAASGPPAAAKAELNALTRLFDGVPARSVTLGAPGTFPGHTFANAGLAGVAKAALALYHRRIPPHRPTTDLTPTFRSARTLEPWPAEPGGEPRRAAVCGASLTGALCHLLLEEHDSRGPKATAAGRPSRGAVDTTHPEPIAVVGYGGRFADASDAPGFWRVVHSGVDRIEPLPDDVLDRELYHRANDASLTHCYTDLGAYMAAPDEPPDGLRITPRRYRAMDAAQRVALAVAAETLTRHGHADNLTGHRGMVAIGSNLGLTRTRRLNADRQATELDAIAADLPALAPLSDRARARLLDCVRARFRTSDDPLTPVDLDGCLAGGVAALVAGEYRLSAVPVAVEAACASSLAALDVAVGALRSGDVDYALAGGAEIVCHPRDLVLCSALGLLSHTRITPFDTAADGFSPGDGCALFLLKRLSDAVRDDDPIFGLLRGIGGSNDARSLIAPDVDGQVRAMRQAFEQVEFDPSAVDYLEAHGTGTRVGDRAEISATVEVYAKPGRPQPLVIGSAKSFFGHTFAAAGAAGLLKALLSMRARTFPPNANLRTPAADLPLDDIPARLPTAPEPWPAVPGRPRRAGVSSFGTGGINYHLLVEEYEDGSG